MSISSSRLSVMRFFLLFLFAVTGLWTIDLLVNLRTFQRAIGPDPPLAGWLDFVGLLQAEVPIALFCMLGSLSLVGLRRLALPA